MTSQLTNDTAHYQYKIKGSFPEEKSFPNCVFQKSNKQFYKEPIPAIVEREITVMKDSNNRIIEAKGTALLENGFRYTSIIEQIPNTSLNFTSEIFVEKLTPLQARDEKGTFLYDYPSIISFYPNWNLVPFPGHFSPQDFNTLGNRIYVHSSYLRAIPREINPINFYYEPYSAKKLRQYNKKFHQKKTKTLPI